MLLIIGFAAVDPLTLKEGVTVVVPDHKPLLALVVLFGKYAAAAVVYICGLSLNVGRIVRANTRLLLVVYRLEIVHTSDLLYNGSIVKMAVDFSGIQKKYQPQVSFIACHTNHNNSI